VLLLLAAAVVAAVLFGVPLLAILELPATAGGPAARRSGGEP